ncbi:ABC transporter ATP-binding protein [Saccharibacillus sp. CPCC 101409]|uniref:ATP-binding cassette domain-containing protein n=1 Tax=Saccharibacillus sp. CPCC 101409 TaxID=3058041 RepID=UPI0026720DE4|nr:ABC transporter ATP-binding protein [Saccharibacillus sp. CPCC 101409]MDO3409396.1 ABC transporter ATP-binding protein [Saccharibacillus sp. CPCC 101409]
MTDVLKCSSLVKAYGRTEAVKSLNLNLNEHTIYGLLGRNGAGKTTLLDMITGGLFPDGGEIRVHGQALRRGEVPRQTCYVREKNFYPGGAKVGEVLNMASTFYPDWDSALAERLLGEFKLNSRKKMRQLSRGMESLVGNIVGLASRAPLTIFDEPVLGLDVLMRERFYRVLLEDYAEYPRTILLSTHLIDEIATVVERVYIMESGDILLNEEVEQIRERAYLVNGSGGAVEAFTSGRRVLYRENYGSHTIAALYGEIGAEERREAQSRGIEFDGLPLQKFFAYLIEGGQEHE